MGFRGSVGMNCEACTSPIHHVIRTSQRRRDVYRGLGQVESEVERKEALKNVRSVKNRELVSFIEKEFYM